MKGIEHIVLGEKLELLDCAMADFKRSSLHDVRCYLHAQIMISDQL